MKNIRSATKNQLDYYPTPPSATYALCEDVLKDFDLKNYSCWEPACGENYMSDILKKYFKTVRNSDIENYGDNEIIDFLNHKEQNYDWIITNPPYNLSLEFALKSLNSVNIGASFLVRTAWLESKIRYDNLFSKHPPFRISQFVQRVQMQKNTVEKTSGSSTIAYCWITWLKNHSGKTEFTWIEPHVEKFKGR
jgi:hypothetical protein